MCVHDMVVDASATNQQLNVTDSLGDFLSLAQSPWTHDSDLDKLMVLVMQAGGDSSNESR